MMLVHLLIDMFIYYPSMLHFWGDHPQSLLPSCYQRFVNIPREKDPLEAQHLTFRKAIGYTC